MEYTIPLMINSMKKDLTKSWKNSLIDFLLNPCLLLTMIPGSPLLFHNEVVIQVPWERNEDPE